MHFFNPVPKMKLLEIVRALETSDATVQACATVGRRMGKEVVALLKALGLSESSCLLTIEAHDGNVWKSARNIPTLSVSPASDLNAYDLLQRKTVLVTKGVLRVASRFHGNDADKRNIQTDGRIAVANMIGFGDQSRSAHLGLIALAAEVCLPENPQCAICPLRDGCVSASF